MLITLVNQTLSSCVSETRSALSSKICKNCEKPATNWGNKKICSACWWKIQDQRVAKTWWEHNRETVIHRCDAKRPTPEPPRHVTEDTPYASSLPPKKFEEMNEKEWKTWVESNIKQLTGKTVNLTFGGKDA